MRKTSERTAAGKSCELEAVLWEACEDHLGVALIQPGGSRYEQMKWQEDCPLCKIWLVSRAGMNDNQEYCNKGGTAYITSLAIEILQGTLSC